MQVATILLGFDPEIPDAKLNISIRVRKGHIRRHPPPRSRARSGRGLRSHFPERASQAQRPGIFEGRFVQITLLSTRLHSQKIELCIFTPASTPKRTCGIGECFQCATYQNQLYDSDGCLCFCSCRGSKNVFPPYLAEISFTGSKKSLEFSRLSTEISLLGTKGGGIPHSSTSSKCRLGNGKEKKGISK